MSSNSTSARDFYLNLGIEVGGYADSENVMISCFANPLAHRRDDRDKSCSLHLPTGKWNCHGCGQTGNAYQAALMCGHSDREARRLAQSYGLFVEAPEYKRPKLPSETQLKGWRKALQGDARLMRRLYKLKGWTPEGIRRTGLGWDGERLTFPVRAYKGQFLKLVGVGRYLPNGKPKMLMRAGSRRLLFPAPEVLSRSLPLFLVEGEPAAVSVFSAGHRAVAVPGVNSWRPEFAQRLQKFEQIIVLPDCDAQGRDLAERISELLPEAKIVDLEPSCHDGMDIGDLVAEAANDGGVWQIKSLLDGLIDSERKAGVPASVSAEKRFVIEGSDASARSLSA